MIECLRCEGCGKVDDGDGAPWIAWLSLPLKSSAAVLMGIVLIMLLGYVLYALLKSDKKVGYSSSLEKLCNAKYKDEKEIKKCIQGELAI